MRFRLQTRHALVLVCMIALIVVTLAATLIDRFITTSTEVSAAMETAMQERLRQQVQNHLVQITQLLSENVVNPLYAYDMDAMRQLLQTAKHQPGVQYVYVLDPDLRVVHDGDTLIPDYGKRVKDEFATISTPLMQPLIRSSAELMDVTMPVQTGGIVLGYMRLGISLEHIERDVENILLQHDNIARSGLDAALNTIYLVSLGFLVLGVAVAIAISRRLTRPINALLDGFERVRRGDLDTPVAIAGEDELAGLAARFNEMRVELKESSHALAERNRELEQQISERKELDARLAQAEKMDAIGRLAGGVAHDFNNHLTIIKGNAELLSWAGLKGEDREAIDTILSSTVSASGLTRQLLAFARQGPMQHAAVDIHELVQDVVRMLSRSIDKRIGLEVEITDTPCRVQGDATQLQNLLINLGLNACDAIAGAGTITMRVDVTDKAPEELDADGDYVRIVVHDTGTGIAEENLGNVFEPFFTTKDFGHGTGLGLAAAYGAAKAHGGALTLDSRPGDTEFSVYLPRVAAATVVPKDSVPATPLVVDSVMKGLVIDDEAGVRRVMARMLKTLGYEVETCESGDIGVEVVRARPGAFNLVVLDMMMPGMTGTETLAVLRQLDPLIPILVASGHSFEDFPKIDANTRTLSKPITREELRQCVETLVPVQTELAHETASPNHH